MSHQLGKHRVLGQHRVNAMGARALKHIPAHRPVIDPGRQRLSLSRKLSRVEPLETAMFSLSAPGYMRLDSHTDGALGLSVISLLDGETPEQVFRHCLAEGPPEPRKRRR